MTKPGKMNSEKLGSSAEAPAGPKGGPGTEPKARVRPMSKQDCQVITRKMAEAQVELVEYLAISDDRRDKGCLHDAMMLRVALSGLTVFIDEALNRGMR